MPTILAARPQTTECRNAGLRRTPLKSFSLVAVINFHQNDVAKLARDQIELINLPKDTSLLEHFTM